MNHNLKNGCDDKKARLRKVFWAFTCVGAVFFLLWFLRFFHSLGGEYDFLVRWTSLVSYVLLGMTIGLAVSEKQIQVRRLVAFSLVFSAGFLLAPLVGVGILMLADAYSISWVTTSIIFGGSIVAYLFSYMGL